MVFSHQFVAGSSPLARGLPRCEPGRGTTVWIIPARAGFTGPYSDDLASNRDHPRSRGVYRRHDPRRRGGLGSSPLARGLRPQVILAAPEDRIIPARAGFTWRCRCRAAGRTDHPRSRGVYGRIPAARRTMQGSSPLARGLHRRRRVGGLGVGIIPARAGFTTATESGSRCTADHPRSRGVYRRRLRRRRREQGSSPLARGLRRRVGLPDGGPRIIPARAGFTRGRPP